MSGHTSKTGLWYRCHEFITNQSAGEWSDKQIADDSDLLMEFVQHELSASYAATSARIAALEGALTQAALELEEADKIIGSEYRATGEIYTAAASRARAALASAEAMKGE